MLGAQPCPSGCSDVDELGRRRATLCSVGAVVLEIFPSAQIRLFGSSANGLSLPVTTCSPHHTSHPHALSTHGRPHRHSRPPHVWAGLGLRFGGGDSRAGAEPPRTSDGPRQARAAAQNGRPGAPRRRGPGTTEHSECRNADSQARVGGRDLTINAGQKLPQRLHEVTAQQVAMRQHALCNAHQRRACSWSRAIRRHRYPQLRPLQLALRCALQQHRLADSYTGGLSSFTLFVMSLAIVAPCQLERSRARVRITGIATAGGDRSPPSKWAAKTISWLTLRRKAMSTSAAF
eukprot:501982-Prymnesium_polylepis.2